MNTKNNFFLLLLITVIFIFFIIFLELYARYNNPSWHQNDSVLGWNLKRNFSNKYIQSDFKGNIYEVLLETNKYSLRFNKNVNTTNPDILVIGDSFVADPYASNDKMWFSVLADKMSKKQNKPIIVFAGGGGGYATYQEFLLSQRLSKILTPKIFILQFCSNDFGANIYEIEKNFTNLNQSLRRPYPKEEKSFFESSLIAKITRLPIIGDSKIYNYLLWRISKLNILNNSKKNKMLFNTKLEAEAEIITLKYLKKIRNEFKESVAYMVNCEIYSKGGMSNAKWKNFAVESNFIPLERANFEIEKSIRINMNIFYKDGGHFNELGNYIFGKVIFEEMIAEY
jgi:hypothetical protein